MKNRLFNKEFWAYALFWSWNVIFLTFMILGFAPTILPEMITAVQTGTIPMDFLIYASILTLIPVLAVILGATRLRREPGRLFVLGYGVEGPLMLLLAVRFFIIRDQTPAVVFIQIVALLGLATLLWQILDKHIGQWGRFVAIVRVFGLTLLFVTGLYASLWLAFYALPLAYSAVKGLVDALGFLPLFFAETGRALQNILREDIRFIPFSILGFLLLVYTGTLFVLMPITVPIIYGRAWWGGVKHLCRGGGQKASILVPATVLAGVIMLFWLSNRQPQAEAFALLAVPPVNVSEMTKLRDQEGTIRAGLLNAYLAPQRYISAEGEVFHIRELYKDMLDLPESSAAQVQQTYEKVAQPLLYRPVNPPPENLARWSDNRALNQEPQQAAELYERFFDEPIVDGEEEAVLRAVRATWNMDQARANWQAVADREVFLAEQAVTVNEHGDWAEVELYEVYENQTGQNQEVVYYFSLPESAVINGVWLGESADRENRYAYQVAPRGAAQALYRNEVRRQVDPALVEQIGPRQYRLRIFPVPPLSQSWNGSQDRTIVEEAPPLHMWLTYRVMGSENGWPLPQLADERNVYWDEESNRSINGASLPGDEAAWLPPTVAGKPNTAAAHQVRFANDTSVTAVPEAAIDLPSLAEVFGTSPEGLRLAAILDRSRSMGAAANQLEDALTTLATSGAAVDIFLTASEFHGEQPAMMPLEALQVEQLEFYGGQNAAELLAQYEVLRGEQGYDAILVLTDGSGYKLGGQGFRHQDGLEAMPIPDAPLWMVHVDGNYPLGYDDATLEAIQASGGGVAGSIDEALRRLSVRQLGGVEVFGTSSADLVDGYLWQVASGDQTQSPVEAVVHDAGDPFAALAARRLILAAMQENQGDLSQLDILDQLHETAVEQSIITPYSSMIVLVDARQKQLLDKLSNQDDRFQRELEQIGETTPVTVTGVPEPHEWLLIGLALLILAWFVKVNKGDWGLDTERV
jgi:putative PEP-CTERM system integral membrane protein